MNKREKSFWRIMIPGYWPPTPNELGEGRGRGRHHVIQKHKDRARDYVAAYVSEIMPKFKGKVKLTIIRQWGYRQRALDPDNLVASAKFLIDALRQPRGNEQRRRLGIIEDDRPDNFIGGKPIIKQEKSPGREKYCIIEIEGYLDED